MPRYIKFLGNKEYPVSGSKKIDTNSDLQKIKDLLSNNGFKLNQKLYSCTDNIIWMEGTNNNGENAAIIFDNVILNRYTENGLISSLKSTTVSQTLIEHLLSQVYFSTYDVISIENSLSLIGESFGYIEYQE